MRPSGFQSTGTVEYRSREEVRQNAFFTRSLLPDKPERLDKFDLFEAGWPDQQQVDIDALSSRVYNALKELKNRGLDGTILTDAEGYDLNPEVDMKLES